MKIRICLSDSAESDNAEVEIDGIYRLEVDSNYNLKIYKPNETENSAGKLVGYFPPGKWEYFIPVEVDI